MNLHVDNPDWQQLLHQFEDDRRRLDEEETSIRRLAHRAITLSTSYLLRLLESSQLYIFKEREEVYFFKHLKPHFQGHVIFYSRLFKIETDRPPAIPAGIAFGALWQWSDAAVAFGTAGFLAIASALLLSQIKLSSSDAMR